MSGTIAYCSREQEHLSPLFVDCLAGLMANRPGDALVHVIGNDIADNRNRAVRAASGDWIWFIDTDMVFQSDVVDRLLAHDVAIVQAFCLMRNVPHEPILYRDSLERRSPLPTEPSGLVPVRMLGAGGTLYRSAVFQALADPWFEGIIGSEDTCVALKAKAAGFGLYTDLSTPVGHITPAVVWPDCTDGAWGVRYQMGGHSIRLGVLQGATA